MASALLMNLNAGIFTQGEEEEELALKVLKKLIALSVRVFRGHTENQCHQTQEIKICNITN